VTATASARAADTDIDADPDSAGGPHPIMAPVDVDEPTAVPPALRGWRDPSPLTGWYLTVLLTVIGGFTRLWALTVPQGKQFDEVYYATEAQEMLRYGYENNPGYGFIVHPSVGKWCIAITSYFFGNNELGWRLAPAIAGTACVFMIIRIARRMFRSNLMGAIAGSLMIMDGVSMVLSRIALLDIFLETFVLAGFGALVIDRDQFRSRLARFLADGGDARAGVPALGPRPWRMVGAILLALACGVKWSGLSFLVLFALASLAWDFGALKAAGVRWRWNASLRRSWLGAVGSLGFTSLATYAFTWLGWWAGENSYNRHWADTVPAKGVARVIPGWIRSLIDYHSNAYRFHSTLDTTHPYKATAWSWLALGRPILFTFDQTPDGQSGKSTCGAAKCVSEVLLIGTPLMWWAFVPVLLWLLWHWATTRDWRAGAVLVAFIAGWVVYLPYPRRTSFLFYMAPLMPFLILGLTLALGTLIGAARVPSMRLLRYTPNWGVLLASLYLGVVVADFAWMWPVFADVTMTYRTWQEHMWFPSWV
jgi:dolichyl-phosphate-mannose-protein mannosyltransferase